MKPPGLFTERARDVHRGRRAPWPCCGLRLFFFIQCLGLLWDRTWRALSCAACVRRGGRMRAAAGAERVFISGAEPCRIPADLFAHMPVDYDTTFFTPQPYPTRLRTRAARARPVCATPASDNSSTPRPDSARSGTDCVRVFPPRPLPPPSQTSTGTHTYTNRIAKTNSAPSRGDSARGVALDATEGGLHVEGAVRRVRVELRVDALGRGHLGGDLRVGEGEVEGAAHLVPAI